MVIFNAEFLTNQDLPISLGVTYTEFSLKYIWGYSSPEIKFLQSPFFPPFLSIEFLRSIFSEELQDVQKEQYGNCS